MAPKRILPASWRFGIRSLSKDISSSTLRGWDAGVLDDEPLCHRLGALLVVQAVLEPSDKLARVRDIAVVAHVPYVVVCHQGPEDVGEAAHRVLR